MKLVTYAVVGTLILAMCLPWDLLAGAEPSVRASGAPAFMEIRLDAPANFRHVKTGDRLSGKVVQNVFSGNRLIVPGGSRIALTVASLERRRKGYSAILPWPVRYLHPMHENFPAFDFADVTLPGGENIRLRVSADYAIDKLLKTKPSRGEMKRGEKPAPAPGKASPKGGDGSAFGSHLELVVDPDPADASNAARPAGAGAVPLPEIKTVGAGTEAKLALLGALSASKSRTGDPFQALLIEPLRLNAGLLLPEGTVFEGRVTRSTPARWLSRSGSLYLTFNRLVLPAGTRLPIAASVAGVGVDRQSHMTLTSEGGLTGGSAGKGRVLMELGIGVGLSKVTDDGAQLIAEALVSTATDASTAGVARLAGFAVSGVYWLTRHGRDVALPPYTTFTIRFDRPPDFPPS